MSVVRRPAAERPEPARRRFARFRSRHPFASRALRNLAIAAVVTAPLVVMGRRKEAAARALTAARRGLGPSAAARKAGRSEVRRLRTSAHRWKTGAVIVGSGSGSLAVGGPMLQLAGERRDYRRAQKRQHPVLVINRTTGERRIIYQTRR